MTRPPPEKARKMPLSKRKKAQQWRKCGSNWSRDLDEGAAGAENNVASGWWK
jgi:hypothetical protein